MDVTDAQAATRDQLAEIQRSAAELGAATGMTTAEVLARLNQVMRAFGGPCIHLGHGSVDISTWADSDRRMLCAGCGGTWTEPRDDG